MEEEEGITDLMKEEAVLSMDLGKFLQNTFGPCFVRKNCGITYYFYNFVFTTRGHETIH